MAGVAAQLGRLAAAFPKEKPSPATVDMYLEQLADVPPAILHYAVTTIIRTHQEPWFPTVGAIRAACAELALGLPSEAEALAQIDARIGWGRDHAGVTPAVHPLVEEALARVGGYAAFRQGDSGVVKGQWGRVYRDLRAAAITRAQDAPALNAGPQRAALDAG